jgi:hypothetical protein
MCKFKIHTILFCWCDGQLTRNVTNIKSKSVEKFNVSYFNTYSLLSGKMDNKSWILHFTGLLWEKTPQGS